MMRAVNLPNHTPANAGSMRNSMQNEPSLSVSPPPQNVVFAVNYAVPSVNHFVPTTRKPAERVEATASTTSLSDDEEDTKPPAAMAQQVSNDERSELVEKDMNRGKRVTVVEQAPSTRQAAGSAAGGKRVSRRERRKKEVTHEKVRVRYDMNHVPPVRRHVMFVQHHRSQAAAHHAHHHANKTKRTLPPRRNSNAATLVARETAAQEEFNLSKCHKCKGEKIPEPFVADSSVVWIPTKRTEWEDCLSEMTAVCTSAALRRHVMASKGLSSSSKPFFAPLSQDYIRDRIDIDDPLEGYQIRHREGGWMQGFIIWTNFTTWSHYFKWDSLHEKSGVPASYAADKTRLVDLDGSLAKELEEQPRSGDPLTTGVVSSSIAEIGLLGGIGCGEYLLRMALDDINSRGGQYKYVVLQATDQSRTFYERFGFVRVGAVGRVAPPSRGQGETNEDDLIGYRHWTYANERNLHKYGGPSYMMALRLPRNNEEDTLPTCSQCATEVPMPTVIEQLKAVAVEEKPKIAQLGAAPTPYKKRVSLTPGRKSTPGAVAALCFKRTPNSCSRTKRALPDESLVPSSLARVPSASGSPNAKRRKTLTKPALLNRQTKEKLLTPPPPGQALSFAQKQYQSVWLAVSPTKSTSGGRIAPRERDALRKPAPYPSQPKRGPGRPKKYPIAAVAGVTELSVPHHRPKSGRGRPRKNAPLPIDNVMATLSDPSKLKRGPGRPRKNPPVAVPVNSVASLPAQSQPKRGPGRPRKNSPTSVVKAGDVLRDPSHFPKRDPGRVPVNIVKSSSSVTEPPKSKPGQPRKNSSGPIQMPAKKKLERARKTPPLPLENGALSPSFDPTPPKQGPGRPRKASPGPDPASEGTSPPDPAPHKRRR